MTTNLELTPTQFEIALPGPHAATILDIVDKGKAIAEDGHKYHKLMVIFRIDDQIGNDPDTPVTLHQSYNASFETRSNFYALITATGATIVFGKTFAVDSLVGRTLNIEVQIVTRGNIGKFKKRYARIIGYPKTIAPRPQPILITATDNDDNDEEDDLCYQTN
jgi:hypothetical protein